MSVASYRRALREGRQPTPEEVQEWAEYQRQWRAKRRLRAVPRETTPGEGCER